MSVQGGTVFFFGDHISGRQRHGLVQVPAWERSLRDQQPFLLHGQMEGRLPCGWRGRAWGRLAVFCSSFAFIPSSDHLRFFRCVRSPCCCSKSAFSFTVLNFISGWPWGIPASPWPLTEDISRLQSSCSVTCYHDQLGEVFFFHGQVAFYCWPTKILSLDFALDCFDIPTEHSAMPFLVDIKFRIKTNYCSHPFGNIQLGIEF